MTHPRFGLLSNHRPALSDTTNGIFKTNISDDHDRSSTKNIHYLQELIRRQDSGHQDVRDCGVSLNLGVIPNGNAETAWASPVIVRIAVSEEASL